MIVLIVTLAVILLILAVTASIVSAALKPKKATVTTTTLLSSAPPPAKGLGWAGWVIIVLLIFGIGTVIVGFWPRARSAVADAGAGQNRGTNTNIQPREWVFEWKKKPGEWSIGRQGHTLAVEITKDTAQDLWLVLHDKKDGVDIRVAGLRLNKTGEDLIGNWENYLDGDGGPCYLYKRTAQMWAGHYELKDSSHTDCFLTKK
jgi:hypothetical protein